jgi:hypothetical protein
VITVILEVDHAQPVSVARPRTARVTKRKETAREITHSEMRRTKKRGRGQQGKGGRYTQKEGTLRCVVVGDDLDGLVGKEVRAVRALVFKRIDGAVPPASWLTLGRGHACVRACVCPCARARVCVRVCVCVRVRVDVKIEYAMWQQW